MRILQKCHRTAAWTFLFLLALYIFTYGGHIYSIDEAYMVSVTASLGKGLLNVNQVAFYQKGFEPFERLGTVGVSGDVFCKKGIGISLLAFPFFWISKIVPAIGAVHSVYLTNGIITAATGALLFAYLTALGFSPRASLISALVWGTGTCAWPYARMFFSEPAGAFGLLLAFYGGLLFRKEHRFRDAMLCGIGMGWTVATLPTDVLATIFPLIDVMYEALRANGDTCSKTQRNAIAGIITGLAGPAAITIAYNMLRFGRWWDTGYRLVPADFTTPPYIGITGLLISPARGLLFYSPVLLLVIPGLYITRRKYRRDLLLTSISVTTCLMLFSVWRDWHGGWSWGPRYMVPTLPLMFVPITGLWDSKKSWSFPIRSAISVLVGISILVQIIGVAVNYVETEFVLDRTPGLSRDAWFYRGKVAMFNLALSPLVVQTRLLLQGHLDWDWIRGGHPDTVALFAALAILLIGGIALRAIVSHHAPAEPEMLYPVLLLCAGIIVIRATDRMPDRLRDDGRMEAIEFVSIHRQPGDGMVSNVGYLYELILDEYPRLPPACILPEPSVVPNLLEIMVSRYARLWFVGKRTVPDDPAQWVEEWLSRNAFPLQSVEFGMHRVVLFGIPGEVVRRNDSMAVKLGDVVRLTGFALTREKGNPKNLQLTLYWEAIRSPTQDYAVFVHVYNRNGEIIAQADHTPVNGLRPVSTWQPGETVVDRITIPFVPDTQNEFTLAVGMYDRQFPDRRLTVCMENDQCVEDGRVWLIGP